MAKAMTGFVAAGSVVMTVLASALLSGCGSDGGDSKESTSSSAASSSAATSSASPSPSQAAGPRQTLGQYFKENNIQQTPVKRDTPGAPQLNLPLPAGWKDSDASAPQDAYGMITIDPPADPKNPAAIIARMAKLPADVDQAKILELAPNVLLNLPGFEGPDAGSPSKLGGFDADQIAGTTTQNGETTFVARKTVVIPGPDAVYVLALDAQGPQNQQDAIQAAMAEIDEKTTITV